MAKVTPGNKDKQNKGSKDKGDKPKRVRVPFRADNAPKLTAAPKVASYVNGAFVVAPDAVATTFNPRTHKGLKKGDFENAADFVDFQASMLDLKAAVITHQANDRRAKASLMRTAGPSAKKASKLSRVMAEQQDLIAGLTAEFGEDAVKAILEKAAAKAKELQAKKAEKEAAAPAA